jgi:hypothetical protein
MLTSPILEIMRNSFVYKELCKYTNFLCITIFFAEFLVRRIDFLACEFNRARAETVEDEPSIAEKTATGPNFISPSLSPAGFLGAGEGCIWNTGRLQVM